MWKWVGLAFAILILGSMIVALFMELGADRKYTTWDTEGVVISYRYIDGSAIDRTKIKLDTGRTVTIEGKHTFSIGEKYNFIYKKYDDWWSRDSECFDWELLNE